MENVWQSTKTNPALMMPQKTIYALPSVFLNYHHTLASYNDVVFKNAEGSRVLDLDNVLNRLDGNNFVRMNADIDLFGVTFGTKLWRASLSHSFKTRALVSYPDELVQMGWNGNADFIGQTVDIGPSFQTMAYSELAAGFAVDLVKFTVGGRLKLLSGIFDASTSASTINLTTEDAYYNTAAATNYQINLSALGTYGDLDDFDPQFDFGPGDLLTQNLGVALDLGIQYKFSEKLTFAASLLDIGRIGWKANTTNFISRGEYTYEGLDLSEILRDEDEDFGEIVDTLEAIFDFQETNQSYSTALPAKLYLSANYRLNDFFRFGGLIYTERFRGNSFSGCALSATADLTKIFSFGAVYSVFKNTYDNVGLNAMIKLGPVQFYGVTDNVMAAFKPLDARNVNVRVGMNLAFN